MSKSEDKQWDTERRSKRPQPSPPQDKYRQRPDVPVKDNRETDGGKFPGEER